MAGPPLLDALFRMIEDRSRRMVLSQIHKEMDVTLMQDLETWMGDQNIKVSQVLAVAAYFLAHTIYDEVSDEDEGCSAIQMYNDYTHSVVHRLFQEFPKEQPSNVTPMTSKKHH
jgi:hypothetical protein